MSVFGDVLEMNLIKSRQDGSRRATLKHNDIDKIVDDVKDVSKGYDCGMQIKNYNDIEQLDLIEAFQEVEVKRKVK